MPSQLTVHFYLPDAIRTACNLPIRGVPLISRRPDQTECQACIKTTTWETAAALQMERALDPPKSPTTAPVPGSFEAFEQLDWLGRQPSTSYAMAGGSSQPTPVTTVAFAVPQEPREP